MPNWENIHTETREGFLITLSTKPEDMPPVWDETEEEHKETLRKIDQGALLYFIARVQATRENCTHVVLGCSYLGGCCYASMREFMQDPYYGDLIDEAINDAKVTLSRLGLGLSQ